MKKWNDLAKELKKEPMILGTRITGESLKWAYDAGLAIKKEYHSDIITFGGLWHANGNNCMEMGSFWIKPEWRGHKLGSQIMEEIYSIFPPGKIIFVITRNRKIIHLLRKYDWEEVGVNDWEEVVPFEASCGPCDQVSEEEKKSCPYKAQEGKCVMFFYQVES